MNVLSHYTVSEYRSALVSMVSTGAVASVQNVESTGVNNEAGCNAKNQGLYKNIRALPSIKTVHVIKILPRFYFRFGFDQGSFILCCSTASFDLTKEQTKTCHGESCVHPNIPTINHLRLL